MVEFCFATGLAPSEYKQLTPIEVNVWAEVLNEMSDN